MADFASPEYFELLNRFGDQVVKMAEEAFDSYGRDPQSVGFEHRGYMKRDGIEYPVYKANITGAYRALGLKKGQDIHWIWFGTHNDYDRLLKRLRK